MLKSVPNQSECRLCALLEASVWKGKTYFRCQAGKFDDQYGRKYFVWQSIWRPNPKVATAQKDCSHFKLYPQVKQISRRGAP
jgi:hypothetical protein